jgi:hypothetical protein
LKQSKLMIIRMFHFVPGVPFIKMERLTAGIVRKSVYTFSDYSWFEFTVSNKSNPT